MFSLYYRCLLVLSIGSAWSLVVPRHFNHRVAYFVDSDPAGSSIVALKISEHDGTLSSPVRTSTGGSGITALVAVSQHSIVVSEEYIFTVNAASNTVSMFWIDPSAPWSPKLVGSPVSTLGDTPVSVAYSKHINTACVANAGIVAGVTCYSVDSHKGLKALGPLRPIAQPTDGPPPPGPLNSVHDLIFNPSSTALFASMSSNSVADGSIYAWSVTGGHVSTEAVITTTPGLVLPFSLNFIGSDSNLLVTNPHQGATGASYFKVEWSLKLTQGAKTSIPDQQAVCWAAFEPRFDGVFLADALLTNLTIVDPVTAETKGVFHFAGPAKSGAFDMAIDRDWLYFLTDDVAAPKVNVFDLKGEGYGKLPTQVQSFDIFSQVGKLPNWNGLAIYPASWH